MGKIKIKIDGMNVEAEEGTTVLEAAKKAKREIPHFCYHSKLSIAGNCRMCLVNVKGMNKPIISCRERVREGMEVDTASEEVKKMQQGVLEFILLNHPLDCPICDQSGECDLQDNYFKFSKFPSRLEDQKIHKPKATPLGPRVTLDDERCIVCTRCVRFCDEVAGTHELCVTQRGGHSVLTTYPGKPLQNPYSLCTVDICPVGALTSTDFRFKKRVWFLKTAKSLCSGCATGCNIKMDWDDGIVYRYRPRENNAVNETWMCDAGRETYKFINQNRVTDPMVKKSGVYTRLNWAQAIEVLAESLKGKDIVGFLSAQASCEENFAFHRFFKETFGASFIATAKETAKPFSDDFLIDADKNPNRAFLKMFETNGKTKKGTVYVVLDDLTELQKKELIASDSAFIVWFASNRQEGESWADLVLPKPTFAEQEGTFINRKKRIQRFWKAFEPKGQSRPVWKILGDLGRKLERGEVWESAESVFQTLSEELPALKGLTYKEIGEEGAELK